MNEFFELMSHPITIIATILALFFVLMAVFRHSNKRKNTPEAEGGPAGPVRVASPYIPTTAPTSAADTKKGKAAFDTTPQAGSKVFRQFGQPEPSAATHEPDEYVWE